MQYISVLKQNPFWNIDDSQGFIETDDFPIIISTPLAVFLMPFVEVSSV